MPLVLVCLMLSGSLQAQNQFKGKVLDAESLTPVPFATVFIANSTIGAVADEEGMFELTVPDGNHDLVIQHMGYQNLSYSFTTQLVSELYEFRLVPAPVDLEEAKVSDKRDKSWYANLELFERFFLGESINAKRCKILNPEVLVLDDESTPGVLKAYANELLEIENPNLGYHIRYLLTGFEYDVEGEMVSYSGFPYFIEQDLPKRRLRKVKKNRDEAYQGSVAHLIRSLYEGSAEAEGFLFYKTEKAKANTRESDSGEENSLVEIPLEQPIPAGSLTQSAPDGRQFMVFERPLFIVYKNGEEERNYYNYSLRNLDPRLKDLGQDSRSDHNPFSRSQLSRMEMMGKAVQIFPNGSYFHPLDLFFQGYMAWEKVGDLLPFD